MGAGFVMTAGLAVALHYASSELLVRLFVLFFAASAVGIMWAAQWAE